MSTYAVIITATNICDNTVVWDDTLGPWVPPADCYTINIDGLSVGIGWTYDPSTATWVAPPVQIPEAPINPTVDDLRSQLATLSAQIAALG